LHIGFARREFRVDDELSFEATVGEGDTHRPARPVAKTMGGTLAIDEDDVSALDDATEKHVKRLEHDHPHLPYLTAPFLSQTILYDGMLRYDSNRMPHVEFQQCFA
jgi:hypothetical protein